MTATLTRGPSDPEAFRVKVHGSRWYRDPLPADNKWPTMTEAVPAVTTVKKAWNKPFSKKTETGLLVSLDAYRAAEYVSSNLVELADMHPEQAFALIATAPERDLNRAGNRGTAVHAIMEALAAGVRPALQLLEDDVRPYVAACERFVSEWRPSFRMTEVVVINRSIGWGGTCDCVAELPGLGLTVIDWKSRGEKHGAYTEEACQLGGYAAADYFVVQNVLGNLVRIDPPPVTAGAIVSLCPDGTYAVYPVDIDEAKRSWLALFETWRVRRDGESGARRAIGLPLTAPASPCNREVKAEPHAQQRNDRQAQPQRESEPLSHNPRGGTDSEPNGNVDDNANGVVDRSVELDEIHWLRSRVLVIVNHLQGGALPIPWPTGVPTFKSGAPLTAVDLEAIADFCDATEAELGLPFPPARINRDEAADGAANAKGATSVLQVPAADDPTPNPTQRPDSGTTAEVWTERGRALLALLDDEALARACAAAAGCEAVRMSRVHYLALQSVVTQVSAPAGVLVARWLPPGVVQVKPVNDIEAALLAAMPTDETKTKATKGEALRRARNVAKALARQTPKSFADLCDDMVLAACVAVGHGVTDSDPSTTQPQGVTHDR